jgi:peptidoglycan hydrolase-like protein with peptidoglycan-binding domain
MKCGCKHETAKQAIRVFESAVNELQPEQFEFSASGARFLVPPTDMESIHEEVSQWFSEPRLVAQGGAVAAAAARAQRIAAAALAKGAIPLEKACWIQTVLNKAEGESLAVDGVYGQLTRQAIRRFQGRHSLQVDGVVGPQTETALVQAALNSIAQASLVPVNGVMDGKTRQEIKQFQSRNNLVPDGIVGPKTRATMVTALGGQCLLRPQSGKPLRSAQWYQVPSACNKAEYERRGNLCIADAETCLKQASYDMALSEVACSGNPVCMAAEGAKYLLALQRCRDALNACYEAARKATNCR